MSEASLTFTMVNRFGGLTTSSTEYICGQNTRSEARSCTGRSATESSTDMQYEYGPLRAYIHNRDLSYSFELDLAARIYTAFRANEYGSPVWSRPRPIQPFKRSGKTVHVQTETVDTGERQEMFSYTARHVLTRTRQTRDSQMSSESECDGWYIDAPAAWLTLHPLKPGVFCHLVASVNGERDDYKFTETGKRERGFLVLATSISKSFFSDQTGTVRTHENVSHREITEISETPLQPELFVPPRDFRRVPQLPNQVHRSLRIRARLRWEMLKDSFSLPNGIAKFIDLRRRN